MTPSWSVVPMGDVSTGDAADAFASAFAEEGHPPSEWRSMLRHELDTGRADARASMVIVEGRQVVGACIANVGEEPLGHVGATGIRPRFRRRGRGRALVQAVLDALDSQGRTDVSLEVEPSNHRALALYESLGFRRRRALHTLVLNRERMALGPPIATTRSPLYEALAAIDRLHPEVPAFQRRTHYLGTFSDRATSLAVVRGGPPLAIALLSGSILYDLAALPEPDLVRGLLASALASGAPLRLIHVADDDPLLPILLDLGATVATVVDELVRVTG